MTNKNGSILKLLSICVVSILAFSCNKEEKVHLHPLTSNNVKSVHPEVPEVSSTIMVPREYDLVKNFIKENSAQLQNVDLENASYYFVRFKNLPSLVGLQIHIKDEGATIRDIFSVTDLVSKNLLTVIRDKIGFNDRGNNTGRVLFKSINGMEFSNDSIRNQTIVNPVTKLVINQKINKDSSYAFSVKSNKLWNCTEAQFSEYYQAAKKTCNDDFLCDLACTINPCAISYIAYAVGRCSGIINADNTIKNF